MKLSEAIRLGAMLGPQQYGTFFGWRNNASCAMGAAFLAVGFSENDHDGMRKIIRARWPWIFNQESSLRCPVCKTRHWGTGPASRKSAPFHIIANLNNRHKWTRERIAAWVATIEPAEPGLDQPAPPVAADQAVRG